MRPYSRGSRARASVAETRWRRGEGARSTRRCSSPTNPRHDFIALDDALDALAKFDERKSRVVELRFFGGLSVEETAEVLKVGPDTVMRDWRLAKAWLQTEMGAVRADDA